MLREKAVGVAAAATVPEGRACIHVFVKEPHLDIIAALGTSVDLQLARGCKQKTRISRAAGRENGMQADAFRHSRGHETGAKVKRPREAGTGFPAARSQL